MFRVVRNWLGFYRFDNYYFFFLHVLSRLLFFWTKGTGDIDGTSCPLFCCGVSLLPCVQRVFYHCVLLPFGKSCCLSGRKL